MSTKHCSAHNHLSVACWKKFVRRGNKSKFYFRFPVSEFVFINCKMGRLKGIPPILSPDILYLLSVTGHGDEIGEFIPTTNPGLVNVVDFPEGDFKNFINE